jgi:hypothetical protein
MMSGSSPTLKLVYATYGGYSSNNAILGITEWSDESEANRYFLKLQIIQRIP